MAQNENIFDVKTQPALYIIFQSLLDKGIKNLASFDYLINAAGYATNPIVANTNEKVLFLVVNFDIYQLEGATRVFTFSRYIGATLYSQVLISLTTATSMGSGYLLRNPILCNKFASNGFVNAASFIAMQGYRIELK